MTSSENSTNWYGKSDAEIVSGLGDIIRQFRLQQNITQEKFAVKAGLSRSAICELENGKTATSLITIVQVLRALEQLQVFDAWKPADEDKPLKMAKMPGKIRLRASIQVKYDRKKEENEWEWL